MTGSLSKQVSGKQRSEITRSSCNQYLHRLANGLDFCCLNFQHFFKPRQVFAYENSGDGRLTLTLVKAEAREPFPPGSLKKYVTPERDAEMLDLLKGCSLEVSD
jgi:hypothetical protein